MSAADHTLGALAPLAAYPQFIVALRATKAPLHPVTAIPHNAHDPAIWMPYEQAASIVATWGAEHFGVGFVLTERDPFAVIDIDGALQADGTWSPLSHELCAALRGAVVEVSQSGRGLHVWLQSRTMPPHAKKNTALKIECYSADRYILLGSGAVGTMADDCPGIRDVIARWFPPRAAVAVAVPAAGPRADWVGPTDDGELIERALHRVSSAGAFGGRATFKQLWTADVDALALFFPPDPTSSDPYDESSADMALAQHLAWWSGCDSDRMERLMRRSALVRDKWDENPGYLVGHTITNACAQQVDVLKDKPRVAGAAPAPTADQVLTTLREFTTAEQVLGAWLPLAVPLSPVDRERVVSYVQHWGVGPQALKRELKRADLEEQKRQRAQSLVTRAGGLALIGYRPEASAEAAATIEAAIVAASAPGEYVSFAGVLSHITTKPLPFTHLIDRPEEAPPAVPQIEPIDKVAMLQRIERVAVLCETKNDGSQRPIGVPDRIIEILIAKKSHAAPIINGLVTHPIVLRDGAILASDGLHAASGLYLFGANVPGVRAYRHDEAEQALHRLRLNFLDGFEFASALDADVALAGLFTGVQRRLLDGAPGLAALASMQSSGKTTLARRIHLILTGRDMPVSTFPLGDEAEASKRLLSALLRSPAMIVFDNVQDGFTFASGSLAAAMTSSSIEQRVLGVSRDATAPTTVLFVLTGNNLTLGNDEVSRWLVTRLAPANARPQERTFKHADVVGHALSIRAQVLSDVAGIVSGFIVSGAPAAASGTRFPAWDHLVRQPLLWAGAADVAQVFRINAEHSEPVRAHRALLWALSQLFGSRWFKASEVSAAATDGQAGAGATLRFALESLAVRAVDRSRSVSHALTANLGRVAEVDGRELRLGKEYDAHDKIDVFNVATVPALRGCAGF